MQVLVTGREGQLARSLGERAVAYPEIELLFAGRPECDLAQPGSAAAVIRDTSPALVVNAAAYTAVDRAEQEPELAHRVNGEAAGEIAAAAAAVCAPIIHLSTDYVFGGTGSVPLQEEEPIAPLGVYGQSKAEGEKQVRNAHPDHLILRTAWVYSPFGSNFVKTMLRLSSERDEISVVDDQVGSPTSALDLADLIFEIVERRLSGDKLGWGEIYHAAGSGQASWADLAEEVMRVGRRTTRIRRISRSNFPTPAVRPAWSVLDGTRLRSQFGRRLPDWRESLAVVIEQLSSQDQS